METSAYGISRTVDMTPAEAEAKVRETLKTQGFGILTEIDVTATLKAKIGAEMKPYKILGACNPPFAHKMLTNEPEIGLLLPCNVVVYEDDNGKTIVAAFDPAAAMKMTDNPVVHDIAGQVREKLVTALEAV